MLNWSLHTAVRHDLENIRFIQCEKPKQHCTQMSTLNFPKWTQ
jgi:hypothetical protein